MKKKDGGGNEKGSDRNIEEFRSPISMVAC
jgi:hypothetical protein